MTKDTALLVASVKNEGPYLLEWVAHHRLCGFDRIQIHQNDSTDTTVRSLRTLDRIGAIEFHEGRQHTGEPQMRAYRRAARTEAFQKSDWCMALNADEFLTIKAGNRTVMSLIDACPKDAATILVNRRLFGSNGESELSNKLVTERFTHAEPAEAIRESEMSPVKALFRTSAFGRPGMHLPRAAKLPDPLICNASGLVGGEFLRRKGRALDPGGRRFAQINHYKLRDLPSFLFAKFQDSAEAPEHQTCLSEWRDNDRNDEEDLSLAARTAAIWAEMRRLDDLADGKLLRLRQRAQRQKRLRIAELETQTSLGQLREDILAACRTPSTPAPVMLYSSSTPVFTSVRAAQDSTKPKMRRVANS